MKQPKFKFFDKVKIQDHDQVFKVWAIGFNGYYFEYDLADENKVVAFDIAENMIYGWVEPDKSIYAYNKGDMVQWFCDGYLCTGKIESIIIDYPAWCGLTYTVSRPGLKYYHDTISHYEILNKI